MDRRIPLLLMLFILAVDVPTVLAKALDPYKVLGVDKSATQREIQKAFHKLSLQYHPDKNKSQSAKEKFTEINNAYEILSDEEKRKNYDLYGDETGRPSFDAGDVRNGNGYTHFTGGPGSDYFTSNPGGYQKKGGQANTQSFSFSFGGSPDTGGNPSGFDFGDMFSNIFGGGGQGGGQFGGFSGFGGPNSGFSSSVDIKDVDMQFFNKKIKGQGLTWLLLVYTPSAKGYHVFNSMLEDVARSLSGALKAGRINCQNEQTLCMDLGVSSSRAARLFVYTYRDGDKGSLVEYSGDLDSRSLKNFCQDQLPRFSKRIDLRSFDFSSSTTTHLPQVLLLSTKKDTPVMWRAVSGLYRDRLVFYDAEVHDISDPLLNKLGVDALPAVVGKSVDGGKHVLRTGITVKDLKSGINELSALLERFEKKNKKAASSQAQRPSERESKGGRVPYITDANFDSLCGDKTTVCIIGVYKSSKAKNQLEALLSDVSQKTFTRPQAAESITYTLLDAGKHATFLNAFDRSGYKSLDKLLVAYKPKRGRFAVFTGQMTMEEVEKFTGSVLNGDVRFSQVRQKPVVSQDEDSWRIREWIDTLRGMDWWRWLADWF